MLNKKFTPFENCGTPDVSYYHCFKIDCNNYYMQAYDKNNNKVGRHFIVFDYELHLLKEIS